MPPSYAFVTGSNRGLGLEFTRQLLRRGDHVFATCRRPADADALHALTERHPEQLHLLLRDGTDPESVVAAMDAVASQTDVLHLLLNNAGINGGGRDDRFGHIDPDRMADVFRVNTIGPVLVAQQAAGLLARAASDDVLPKVVNLTSKLGSIARIGGSSAWQSYRASKAALTMLTRLMAFDLAPQGVLAVAVTPGWVQTDLGGPDAALTPAESVQGVLRVLSTLTMEDRGAFLTWDGQTVPW